MLLCSMGQYNNQTMMKNSKNSWLPEEDDALLELHINRGIQSWAEISKILNEEFKIQNKTPKGCRQRFNNHLNPEINRSEWTPQEETTLVNLQKDLGNRWAEISRHLPGRTDNSVKNKFYSKYRKAIRNIKILLDQNRCSKSKELKIGFVYKIMNFLEKYDQSCLSRQVELLRIAKFIKSQIITFQNAECSNMENQQRSKKRLEELMKAVQKFSKNCKRKSSKKKNVKSSKVKQQLFSDDVTPLLISNQRQEKTMSPLDPPSARESNIYYQDFFEEEYFIPIEKKKSDYHYYSVLFDEICQEQQQNFWHISNGEDSFQF